MTSDRPSSAAAVSRVEPPTHSFRFGVFEIHIARRELRRNGVPVVTKPKVFDLLACLVTHHARVVTRDEICRAVWNGATPTDAAFTNVVYEARTALGDDARRQQFIQTFRGRGLRFVAPIVAAPPPAARGPAAPPRSSEAPVPFVGRADLVARLGRTRDAAHAGWGRVVLLEGEAGIGKTSLVQRLLDESAAFRILVGRCPQRSGAPPFWPWIQVLRRLRDECGDTLLASLTAEQVRLLARLAPADDSPAAAPAPQEASTATTFRLFDAVVQLLRAAARETPIAVVLEDAHWADPASLLLLEFLGGEIGDASILVVVTFRGEEPAAGQLASVLGELVRHAHCERLLLGGLAPLEVRALLAAVLGREPEPTLLDMVMRRTDGNPFFVKEVAALVQASANPRAAERLIPPAVQEAIQRRLAALSEQARVGLAVAAVIGRDARREVLEAVVGESARAGLAWLDQALEAQLLVPVPEARGTYRFAHALIQETIYEGLPPTRRAGLHRQVAQAVAGLNPSAPGPHLTELAHHAFEAALGGHDLDAAIEHCARAGAWATSMLAHDEAVEHYGRAVGLIERRGSAGDRAQEGTVLLAFGEAQSRAGDDVGARAAFERAAAAARALGDAEMLARAAIGYGGPRFAGGMGVEQDRQQKAVALLEEAHARLGSGGGPLRVRVLAWLARELDDVEQLARRDALSRRALDLARKQGDPQLVADVLGARREALWGPENVDARIRMTDEMIALAEQTHDRELALKGRMWGLIDRLELGDIDAVRHEIEPCAMLAAQLRQLRYVHGVAVLRATIALLEGRLADAERLAEAALVYERRLNTGRAAPTCYFAQLTVIRREQGRLEELLPLMEASVVMFPIAATRAALGHVYAELDRLDDVRPLFEACAEADFTRIPRNRLWLTTTSLLGHLCAELRDMRRAPMLYDLLLPFARHNVVNPDGAGCYGPPAFHLGLLATLLARWADAEAHLRLALGMFEHLGAVAYVGQGKMAHAAMLVARHGPGDARKARALIAEGLAIADALDQRTLRRRLHRLQATLDGAPPQSDRR